MKNIKHFIWDFDGTLMDTYPNIIRYLKMALNDFGRDADDREIMTKMSVTIPSTIEYYSELYGLPDLIEHYRQYKANEPKDPIKIFPKVDLVLAKVREMGGTNYIFTNRGDTIYELLDRAGLSGEFAEIVTASDPCFKVKPAPDVINYLMEKYGGTVENTVMIGDRLCDLESGYNAGCKTIFLVTPTVPITPQCDWCINDFDEMLELLK